MKKVVYLDLDGVMANFFGGLGRVVLPHEEPMEIYEEGFYRNLPVNEGAKEAVSRLLASEKYEVMILSKPCSNSVYCAPEKHEWVNEHFPELNGKVILTNNKNDYEGLMLVDDHPHKWNGFKGEVFSFNPNEPKASWENLVKKLGC